MLDVALGLSQRQKFVSNILLVCQWSPAALPCRAGEACGKLPKIYCKIIWLCRSCRQEAVKGEARVHSQNPGVADSAWVHWDRRKCF